MNLEVSRSEETKKGAKPFRPGSELLSDVIVRYLPEQKEAERYIRFLDKHPEVFEYFFELREAGLQKTLGHSIRSLILFSEMPFLDERVRYLGEMAGATHDCGKAAALFFPNKEEAREVSRVAEIPDKEPLTEDEKKTIKKHMDYAREILRKIGIPKQDIEEVMHIVMAHHERAEDRSGYPRENDLGREEDRRTAEISEDEELLMDFLSIVDSCDTMLIRKRMPVEEVKRQLIKLFPALGKYILFIVERNKQLLKKELEHEAGQVVQEEAESVAI